MNLKNKILTVLFLAICSTSFSQINSFNYKRELQNVSEDWHKIPLTPELFNKLNGNVNGIRIYGITAEGDTLEAPYILKVLKGKKVDKTVNFKQLNTSRNSKGYYYTFNVPTDESINQIDLDFKNENFDWKLDLQGSHDQKEWFTIVDDYRILSIKNNQTDYEFTSVNFPNSKYTYYRILIKNDEKPTLNNASLLLDEITDASLKKYEIKNSISTQNKNTKQSIIDIELAKAVPLSKMKFNVNERFDYYRPLQIQYLKDSTKTEKGWKYSYQRLIRTTLSSVEDKAFVFGSMISNKIRIIIDNGDNTPLTLNDFVVEGYSHELVARFTSPATYYLTYGNETTYTPRYDIASFLDKIPTDVSEIALGDELVIEKDENKANPLFQNKLWMWAIMILIILVMGWFTIKMLGKK